MFVYLSKILPQFVYPFGLTFILLVLALIFHRRPRWQNGLIIAVLVIIFITGNTWVANGLMRSLEWQYLPLQNIPQAEVIVVLGGGTDAPQFPRSTVELNGAADRIFYAANLYHQDKAEHILLSGGSITWLDSRISTSAEEMASVISLLGVPDDAIWLQTESRNTHEDALYSDQILKTKGVKRIILITSAAHMPRSVALFKHLGLEVIPAPTDYAITQAGWDNLTQPNIAVQFLNLFPNINNMGVTTSVVKEYLGMLVYRLQGWM